MSSNEEEGSSRNAKKRKLNRACDICRRRKIKCDGPYMPGRRCSHCIAQGQECVYTETQSKKASTSSYVKNLESRLERMESLVNKMCPDPPQTATPAPRDDTASSESTYHTDTSPLGSCRLPITPQALGSSESPDFVDHGPATLKQVEDGIYKLSIADTDVHRYHGKSSGLAFLHSAIGTDRGRLPHRQHDPQRAKPWLQPAARQDLPVLLNFPPDDLLDNLVDLYFRNINDFTPLLHEPTFKKSLAQGLHHRNGPFSGIVSLVCANGARFSRDPRIYVDGPEEWQSAGWMWYEQVERERKMPLAPAQLSDLQICTLMGLFMQGSRDPHTQWALIGAGIRMAIDVGAHRRKVYGPTATVEGELWKRAFWVMVYQEWISSYALGRPSSIHPEDMDVDLPIEVDDEYWTTSDGAPLFQQPPGKQPRSSSFIHILRLTQILTFASRTIYSINKSKAQLEIGDLRWEERVVAELDSALNKWSDSIPHYLRWDPNCEDLATLRQCATLRSHYYHAQIAVHRPFMSAARRESPLSFPSLVICSNAARSAIQLLDTLYKRSGTPYHRNVGTLYTASVVLTMNYMGQKRSGRPMNTSRRDLESLEKCIEMLNALKHELQVMEVVCDLLKGVISSAHVPANAQDISRVDMVVTGKRHRPSSDPQLGQYATGVPKFLDSGFNYISQSTSRTGSLTATPYSQSDPPNTAASTSSTTSQSATRIGTQDHPQSGTSSTMSTSREQQEPFPPSWDDHTQQNTGIGLRLLAHSEQMSPYPIVDNHCESEPLSYPQPTTFDSVSEALAGASQDGGGVQPDQDFAFMDDTMDMWSDAPPSFGWDDWMVYFSNANDTSRDTAGT